MNGRGPWDKRLIQQQTGPQSVYEQRNLGPQVRPSNPSSSDLSIIPCFVYILFYVIMHELYLFT